MKKKVFFACSMRGRHNILSQEFLRQIADMLEEIGLELMSKHQTQQGIIQQENRKKNILIHDRDYAWLKGCDIIAEISNASLGVGAEISDAIHMKKPVLGLYHISKSKISAYIRGKLEKYPKGHHAQYQGLEDLKKITKRFIKSIQPTTIKKPINP